MDCVSDGRLSPGIGRAVDEYYALVDRLIGQWMRRAEEDGATLIVNSDHGFKWGADRSCERGSLNPATAGFWHRIEGVFAAWGARVRQEPERGRRHASSTSSRRSPRCSACRWTAATAGSPIRAAFPRPRGAGAQGPRAGFPCGASPPKQMSEKEASEYAKKLMALGYLSGGEPGKLAPSGGDRPGMTEGAWNNLGLYLSRNGKPEPPGAEEAFRKALALRPDYPSPQFNLAVLYRDARRRRARPSTGSSARSPRGTPIPQGTILRWAAEYAQKGKPRPEREVLERGARPVPRQRADRAASSPIRASAPQTAPGPSGAGALRGRDREPGHPERPRAAAHLPGPAATRRSRLFQRSLAHQARPAGRHSIARICYKRACLRANNAVKGKRE